MSAEHHHDASREKAILGSLTIANWNERIKPFLDFSREKYGLVAEVLNPKVKVWTVEAGQAAIDSDEAI